MSFDTSKLYYTANINNNLVSKETINNLNKQIKETSIFYLFIDFLKKFWHILFIIIFIIILIKLYKNHNKEKFMNYNDFINQPSTFARPTFNPYHSIDENINYNHFLGDDIKDNPFGGVYNNNVNDVPYKNMEFLGLFDEPESFSLKAKPSGNLGFPDYLYNDTKPIININPSVLPQQPYKPIKEEYDNDVVKITYKK